MSLHEEMYDEIASKKTDKCYEEHRHKILINNVVSVGESLKEWTKYITVALVFITISLVVGVIGYHYYGGFNWIESLLDASMILTGMGPVDAMNTTPAKLFAILYALYSGIAFLGFIGVFFYPLFTRMMHLFHLKVFG